MKKGKGGYKEIAQMRVFALVCVLEDVKVCVTACMNHQRVGMSARAYWQMIWFGGIELGKPGKLMYMILKPIKASDTKIPMTFDFLKIETLLVHPHFGF